MPEDHDGAEMHGPFLAGALAGEAAIRSGDIVPEAEYPMVDAMPAEDDEFYLDDDEALWGDDYVPPAA